MEGCRFLGFLILLAAYTACVALGQVKLEVLEKKFYVKEGDSVELKCRVEGLKHPQYTEWLRVLDGGNRRQTYLTNGLLEDAVKDSGLRKRISGSRNFTMKNKMASGIFNLHIKGVRLQDAGKYECTHSTRGEMTQSAKVVVLMKPKVELLLYNKTKRNPAIYPNNSEVLFEDNAHRRLVFTVTGAAPKPEVTCRTGMHDVTGDFNVTYTKMAPKMASEFGQRRVTWDVRVDSLKEVDLSLGYGGNLFSCKAKMPGWKETAGKGLRVKMSGVLPTMNCYYGKSKISKYNPKEVKSGKIEVAAPDKREVRQTGDVIVGRDVLNFNITCDVVATPPAKSMTVKWYRLRREGEKLFEVVAKPNAVQHKNYNFSVQKLSDHKSQMVLVMPRMFPQMMRPYHFIAINQVGTVRQTIKLVQDESWAVVTDDASSTKAAYHLAVVLSLIVAILNCC